MLRIHLKITVLIRQGFSINVYFELANYWFESLKEYFLGGHGYLIKDMRRYGNSNLKLVRAG